MKSGILVINAGSSSIKFATFEDNGQPEPKLLLKGQMEGLGSDPSFRVLIVYASTPAEEGYPLLG